ncbi:TonB-linked outer membrane protein, SusC/RagA family [Mucilaginibacter pineti]|uniref:TonB-linked outer membrane protein, SusC/RagA family n=1 Tax=Mucilaginibacter pineti TaxID=1391627 RepID=A0A1G7FUW6_9SPHI|nr:SusC/RagA family TonB-linked outer membrane protein [Mucilaginibacter pineti]SDE79647.1 TonB-linked outer membrane protein, SusC/RagA family [Mucilaginibacter pineti]
MKKLLLASLCFLLLCVTQVFAQNRTITGTVISKSDGLPLPGVTVKVTGTTIGTQTNTSGKYSLSVPASAKTLTFTFIGFADYQATIGSGDVDASLVASSSQLNEVVVVGYGSGRKASDVVGTVSSVSGKDIENRPSPNAFDALQGKVAGLNILSSSGEPSSTPSLSLNGLSSLGASSTPLVVLDGIPVDPSTVLTLNPNDIESFNVLKDAASTSIYGSRASNGVIYVTTKKGSLNRAARITLTSQYGVSKLANTDFFENFMNAAEFKAFQVSSGQLTQTQLNNTLNALEVKNADTKWYKVYYKDNTPQYMENISISGGGGKTSYYVSGGYTKNEGIAYRSAYKRYTLRSNINSVVTDWMQFGLNLGLAYDDRQTNPSGSNSTNLGLAQLAAPYYSPNDPTGQQYKFIPGWGRYHPAYRASVFTDANNNAQFNPTAYLQLNPIKGLTLKTQGGMDAYDYRETPTQLPSYLGSVGNGNIAEYFTRGVSKTFTNTAEYKFSVQTEHHFTALAGQEYTDGSTNVFGASSAGLSDDRIVLLGSGPNNKNVTSTNPQGLGNEDYAYNSLFGRVDYDYKERYFVEGSVRTDKSSRFGINHRSATFWSAGGSWKAKQENFLKDVSWLDDLTVRASTGTTGNSSIGNYQSLATVSTIANGDASGFNISAAGNPDLTWEKQRLTTFGITTSFFDRIRLEASYYIRTTTDMLVDVPFPYTSGFSLVTSNVGALQNHGFDIELNFDAWKDKTHNGYITPFIVANINHNKVTSLFLDKDYYVVPNTGVAWIVGKPVSLVYPLYKGVNSQTGAPEWYLPDPTNPTKTRKDPNAVTSEFTDDLQQNTGISQYPWLTGSFGLDGGYAGFYVHTLFNFALGKHLINNDKYFYENPNIFPGFNQTKRVTNYWKKAGDNALFPDIENYQFTQFDSNLIENASFMRMKELTIGYAFPKALLERTKVLKGVKLFLTGRNLFTVTKYTGPDPEVDSNLALGNYPNTKQYTFGAEVTF